MRSIIMLLVAVALGACARSGPEGGAGGVPPNPFASNYPSAPPDKGDADRLRPPGEVAR